MGASLALAALNAEPSVADGNPRATLGVTTRETTAGTLTLFDAKGDVIWQAPR